MATTQATQTDAAVVEGLHAAREALETVTVRKDHPADLRRGIAQVRGRLDSLADADVPTHDQTALPDFSFKLTAESPFCPFCGDRDANPIHHTLEHHPDVILDRLEELVADHEQTITFASDGETTLFEDEPDTNTDSPTRDDPTPGETLEYDSDGPPTCECGNTVSKDYLRVFSSDDGNDTLQHCYACKSRTERY